MTVAVVDVDGVRELHLDRPDRYNACDRTMIAELLGALEAARRRPSVVGLVLTGRGRAFCSGQDLAEILAEQDLPGGGHESRLRSGYEPLARQLHAYPKPVVAAVNGVAAGAGLSLACLCATRIASTRASFVPAFIDLGLVPDCGLSKTLGDLVGPARAARWLLDGRRVSAEGALLWGLVDVTVPADQLLPEARATCLRLASRPSWASTTTAELVALAARSSLDTALTAETRAQLAATSRPEFVLP
jgi:2-(1,2-epoxy-1,2-dihydrophenyl)acetyl-CoA isomerase